MHEVFKQQITASMPADEKLNRVRELLQLMCLKIMYDKNLFNNVAFVGGTALRILYDLRRFSEDLDFSLVRRKGYDFSKMVSEILRQYKLYGLKVAAKVKDEKNVHNAMLRFESLLKALGLSKLEGQKLSVKLEVDSNPPKGWHTNNTIVNKVYVLNIVHFDLSSLYSTKLHACFFRKFTKGRDFYDFIWYLGRKVAPNYALLNNAILQTEGYNPRINEQNLKGFLLENVEKVNFEEAKKDVERFLEDKNELNLFDLKAIKKAIESSL